MHPKFAGGVIIIFMKENHYSEIVCPSLGFVSESTHVNIMIFLPGGIFSNISINFGLGSEDWGHDLRHNSQRNQPHKWANEDIKTTTTKIALT